MTDKLEWMRERAIWPNGLRYLWTDAFGLVLLASLYDVTGDRRWLDQAEELVDQVHRVLGRERGLRIGEEPNRDGQYYHYLTKWIFALTTLGEFLPDYRQRALELVKAIHPAFVHPGEGVVWKMQEDLSGPYPGYGLGALDPFDGYVVYRLLDEEALAEEIGQMRDLIELQYRDLTITQDLGLGMMLWMAHFAPDEPWASLHTSRSLQMLGHMWVDPPGYFARHPQTPQIRFRFTNYGISIGLQSVGARPDRVNRLHEFFDTYRSGDSYDTNAITHVMACTSRLPGLFLSSVRKELRSSSAA